MKAFLLIVGSAVLFSGVLQASDICAAPDTLSLHCIYSNFGPSESGQYVSGTSYQSGTGLSVAYTQVGIAFQATGSYYLQDLEVAAFRINSNIPDSVQFSVYDNAGSDPAQGGTPGNNLETFTLSGLSYPIDGLPADPGTLTAVSTLHPLLNAGQFYWIVMSGVNPGDVIWNSTTGPQLGSANYLPPDDTTGSPAAWGAYAPYSQGAVALDGTPGAPEPGTWLLLTAGLGLTGLVRRRTRSN